MDERRQNPPSPSSKFCTRLPSDQKVLDRHRKNRPILVSLPPWIWIALKPRNNPVPPSWCIRNFPDQRRKQAVMHRRSLLPSVSHAHRMIRNPGRGGGCIGNPRAGEGGA